MKVLTALLIGILLGVLAEHNLAPANADTYYIGLAMNTTNSQGTSAASWSTQNRTQAVAESSALQMCKDKWHSDGQCFVAGSSGQCMGVAIGAGDNYAVGFGDTAYAAKTSAAAKITDRPNPPGSGHCPSE